MVQPAHVLRLDPADGHFELLKGFLGDPTCFPDLLYSGTQVHVPATLNRKLGMLG